LSGSGSYTGTFTITAVGGPVTYTISELSTEVPDMAFSIEPASGSLQAGQQATITVSIPDLVSFTPAVTVDPGSLYVGFSYPASPPPGG
jgi:hypothetical protein